MKECLKRIISALLFNKKVEPHFIRFLLKTYPDRVIDASIQMCPDMVTNQVMNAHFDVVFGQIIKNHQKLVVESIDQQFLIEYVLSNYKMGIIESINRSGDGSFRYIGNEKIKVIIGSGGQKTPGWLSTDIDFLNIVERSSWHRLFSLNSIDNILAEHVLEHLSLEELLKALALVREYLKPGGRIRFAVPDAFHPSRYYYNLVKPAGWETPLEHKLFFDHEMISRIAKQSNLKIELLEYFDESGEFHGREYDSDDGVIQRCARNNSGLDLKNSEVMESFYSSIPCHLRQQFIDRNMTYTSLIVDLIK